MKRQLITGAEAIPVKKQHTSPCSDCPFARNSLPGWLGRMSPEQWMMAAHGETFAECHTRISMQCAGMAIFRANVCKSPRSEAILRLPPNQIKVFANNAEFLTHHKGGL